MGFLFGQPKIHGDERSKCLAYLEEEFKLTAFQEKEANLYNNAKVTYISAPREDAAKQMRIAANRLARSATEILKRRGKMASIPDAAYATYFAWQLTYSDYSSWATANAVGLGGVMNFPSVDMGSLDTIAEVHGEHVGKLFLQSEKSREKAMKEMKKLLKRLKLSGAEAQTLFNNASAAIEAENWQPKKSKKS